ncbi:MAG TPA: hypothetical protein VH814_21645 [Steroidobacteraceae bacterium]|jgi:hypothetical protein
MIEVEMNAGELRRLTDDFLGKPTDLAASGQQPAKSPASNARSGSGAKVLRTSLVVLASVAAAGAIAAGVLRDSDKRAAVPPPAPVVVAVAEPPPEAQPAEVPAPEPVVLVNPFDKTEKFTFPPGTSKAEARDQMAQLLLQRAIERGANRPRSRKAAAQPKVAAQPHAPATAHGS